MMTLGNPDLREGAIAAFIGQQESGDAGGIGLESQRQQIVHDSDVFFKARRDARGRIKGRIRRRAKPLGLLDSLLDRPHAAEIFIELLLVASGQLPLQGPGVIEHEVENRMLLLLAALEILPPFAPRARAKKAFEEQPRIGFWRNWCGRRTP